MKKIIFISLLAITFSTNAQVSYTAKKMPDSLVVLKFTNDMTDKTYYFTSSDIVCNNEAKTRGFSLSCFIEGDFTIGDLKVDMLNIGNCVEKNEMIIMFEDGTKITLVSWNEFNCKGNAWFRVNGKLKTQLATKKIKKIQITNGRSYESFTQELEVADMDYFIRLNKMLEKKETYNYTDK